MLDLAIGLAFAGVLVTALVRPKSRESDEDRARDRKLRMVGAGFLVLGAALLAVKFL